MPEPTIRGILFLYYEQGYEGPPWAIQDEKFIQKNDSGSEKWSYNGLHILELGDRLKITDKSGEVVYEGQLELSSANEYGIWYPKGISKEEWIRLFNDRNIAELTQIAPQDVRVAVHSLMPGHRLVRITGYRDVSIWPNLEKGYIIDALWNFASGRDAVPLSLSFMSSEFLCESDSHNKEYCACKGRRPFFLVQASLPGSDNSSNSRSALKLPVRLKKAVSRYFPDGPEVESFEKNSVGGLFSFEANLLFSRNGRPVKLHVFLQDRTKVCGCAYKRDKIGRWKRTCKKEERVCICKNLPHDVLLSIEVM
jgi:hypothetical protein